MYLRRCSIKGVYSSLQRQTFIRLSDLDLANRLSPVLRDAFDITKTSESPQTDKSRPLRFTEDPVAMRSLLNLMEAFKNPWRPSWIPTGADARCVWGLADKYDIVNLIRHTCLLIIHKSDCHKHGIQFEDEEVENEDPQFDFFVWAVITKDVRLLAYVLQRWPLSDPVDWTRARIDIIGWELWHYLVKAYPRAQAGEEKDRWSTVTKEPKWRELIRTGAVRPNLTP
jgi:hypothetical protein